MLATDEALHASRCTEHIHDINRLNQCESERQKSHVTAIVRLIKMYYTSHHRFCNLFKYHAHLSHDLQVCLLDVVVLGEFLPDDFLHAVNVGLVPEVEQVQHRILGVAQVLCLVMEEARVVTVRVHRSNQVCHVMRAHDDTVVALGAHPPAHGRQHNREIALRHALEVLARVMLRMLSVLMLRVADRIHTCIPLQIDVDVRL